MYIHRILLTCLLFTSSSVAIALPLEKPNLPGRFTLHQAFNPRYVRNNTNEMAHARRKWGTKSEFPTVKTMKSRNGSVENNPVDAIDTEYLCTIGIGSPLQELQVDIDTGSSDFWVMSSLQPKDQLEGHATYYKPGESSKLIRNETWSIGYGDGSTASGKVYTDTVHFGGSLIEAQAIEAAETTSLRFSQDKQKAGLVGLGFEAMNTGRPKKLATLFTNLLPGLEHKVFTSLLRHDAPGRYDFGFVDDSLFEGQISYTPVDTARGPRAGGYWYMDSAGYAIGDGDVQVKKTLGGIVDTGTTIMLLDEEVVDHYWSKVSGASKSPKDTYTFDCDADLPDFTLLIPITPTQNYAAVIAGVHMKRAEVEDGVCFGAMQTNAGIGMNIYGDSFLKSQFVVFDRSVEGSPRMGFAKPRSGGGSGH